MPSLPVMCARSSRARCFLYICLSFLLSSTLVTASDQMPHCAKLQLDAESASTWDFCVEEANVSRNWYEAMAACRDFGGELVSLEWAAKIEDIQERLRGRGVNLSSGLFVNAHRPFYSANGFAWSSGMELSLEEDSDYMEQCVKFYSSGLLAISCGSDFEAFPLVCQLSTCVFAKGGHIRIGKFGH